MVSETRDMEAKPRVASAADLPTYRYRLAAAPSDLLTGPLAVVIALADAVIANDARTLAQYDVADRSTHEAMVNRRLTAATLRSDPEAVAALVTELRALQDRDDTRATAGLLQEAIVAAQATADPAATATTLLQQRLAALDYRDHGAWMKQQAVMLGTATADYARGAVRQSIDPVAAASGGSVGHDEAAMIVHARMIADCQAPLAPALSATLRAVIDANAAADVALDIWRARDVVLRADMDAQPVTIAMWDTGVDLSLYPAADDPGFGIGPDGDALPGVMRQPGAYAGRLDELLDLVKGSTDLQGGTITPEAERFQARMRSLDADSMQDFADAMAFAGSYAHGTACSAPAVAGNPLARIQSVAVVLPVTKAEMRLDRTISERRAAFYGDAVARMRRAGVRVVNMSWAITPAMFEGFLQAHGDMADPAARHALAQECYAIEKAALEAAILGAPDLLFVAAAGNDGGDVAFMQTVPSGLSAPNLITVGAVDRAGREALFTSVGGTVAIHANGVEVPGRLPGGREARGSGTSMAAPQVSNAAAKLFAARPGLTAVDVRALLVDTADAAGRVRLLNTRAAFEKAGLAAYLS